MFGILLQPVASMTRSRVSLILALSLNYAIKDYLRPNLPAGLLGSFRLLARDTAILKLLHQKLGCLDD